MMAVHMAAPASEECLRIANRGSREPRCPHMNTGRQLVIVVVGLAMLATLGCEKKKPHLPIQATAPAEPIPTPLPPEITETQPPKPAPAPPKEEAKVEETKPEPPKRHRHKPAQAPPTSGETASGSGNNTMAMAHAPTVPAAEAPPDMAIAADISSAELQQQKHTTAQLLEDTEKTLSGLSHNLSHDQKEMVAQIRSYLAQSRKATTDGDFERAYNLATKAHLLSDALAKK